MLAVGSGLGAHCSQLLLPQLSLRAVEGQCKASGRRRWVVSARPVQGQWKASGRPVEGQWKEAMGGQCGRSAVGFVTCVLASSLSSVSCCCSCRAFASSCGTLGCDVSERRLPKGSEGIRRDQKGSEGIRRNQKGIEGHQEAIERARSRPRENEEGEGHGRGRPCLLASMPKALISSASSAVAPETAPEPSSPRRSATKG